MVEAQTEADGVSRPKNGRFTLSTDDLVFRDYSLNRRTAVGREVLTAAGCAPVEHFSLLKVSPGKPKIVGLEDEVAVERGDVKFVAFDTPYLHRLVIQGQSYVWGASTIAAPALFLLAAADTETEGIWQIEPSGAERLLGDRDVVDLQPSVVERFRVGPIFWLCIEDRRYRWAHSTITTEQIAELGGWSVGDGIIEVDDQQNERQLAPGETITLKPGHSFGKCLRWRRG